MNIHTSITALDASAVLVCGVIWLAVATFLRLKKHRTFVYLLFFTTFYVYIVAVLDHTVFEFQSLFLLNYLSPNHLILKGQAVNEGINLVPLVALRLMDLRTSLLNILMLIPFGFGLPFVTRLQMKGVIVVGALFSVAIELLQLLTGLMARMTFRTADINDVIFNTVGTTLGYMLFIRSMRIHRRLYDSGKLATHPILRYAAERPQVDVP